MSMILEIFTHCLFFQTNESFFLVPKPLRNVKDSEKFWRIDFHKIEATILKGFSKVIIKFLKVEKVIKKVVQYWQLQTNKVEHLCYG